MSERRVSFEHDGHRFEAIERRPEATGPAGRSRVAWSVSLDGAAPALEFEGPYPYRDDDVRRRVLEWYAIQKPAR